jgi:hypothetical protein
MAVRDYVAWHDAYDRAGSPLHRRLQVVIDLLGGALDAAPPGPVRILSLCAGQGHDVVAVASTHARGGDLVGRLVELDPTNAEAARTRIDDLGLTDLEVLVGDAGHTRAFLGAVPADVVVACGIFGNISLEDIERTVHALPSLCAPDASVVWTRHPRESGVLDAVGGWFDDAGFLRESLVVDSEHTFGVARHRLVRDPAPYDAGRDLFTFLR